MGRRVRLCCWASPIRSRASCAPPLKASLTPCANERRSFPARRRSRLMATLSPDRLHLDRFGTPIGTALLVTDDDGALRLLDWEDHEDRMCVLLRRQYGSAEVERGAAPAPVRRPLERYFAGELQALSEIPWRTQGTPFQE